MIPAALDRAIVEILGDANSLGTGFLVSSDGLILTALHVVGSLTQVAVRFGAAAPLIASLVDAGGKDWALFRLTSAVPEAIAPLPAGPLGNLAAEVRWYSVGHANIRAGERGAFHGVVRRVDQSGKLELFCEEFVGRSYDEARGLSGAPCIVDGEAVGLIVEVLHRNDGQIVTGEVHALPLELIRPTGIALNLASDVKLPWEDVITGPLERLAPADRQIAAAAAKLPRPMEGGRLARQIARRMIKEGVLIVAEVLHRLGLGRLEAEQIEEMMSVAETLWVNESAAEGLAVVIDRKVIGLLATELDWSAGHHLRRACARSEPGATCWDHTVVVADLTAESFAEVVVEETYRSLLGTLNAPDRLTVKRRVASGKNVTVFVASPPREDVVKRLNAELPGLLILFMSRAQPSAHPKLDLAPITPAATENDEQLAQIQNGDARARLPKPRSQV